MHRCSIHSPLVIAEVNRASFCWQWKTSLPVLNCFSSLEPALAKIPARFLLGLSPSARPSAPHAAVQGNAAALWYLWSKAALGITRAKMSCDMHPLLSGLSVTDQLCD